MRPHSSAQALFWFVDLALTAAGFAAALYVAQLLAPASLTDEELLAGFIASIAAFWPATLIQEYNPSDLVWFFLWQFMIGTGLNFVLHALLAYLSYRSDTAWVFVSGGLLAALLLTIARKFYAQYLNAQSGVLVVGYSEASRELIGHLRQPLIGVVGNRMEVPSGAPYLGETEQLEEIVKRVKPTTIVIDVPGWTAEASVSLLLRLRNQGIDVLTASSLYERLLFRVCKTRLAPVDLVLSRALQADARTMAIQAIYTNLIGLFFLLILSPVLILVGLAVALLAGPGPVFESVRCLGFRKIPFHLLRFRTRRTDGTGEMTWIGSVIHRLRLINLPQVINIVRGDMALFGPKPARQEFAERLTELMPFYSHRFSVKPGILGWAQMHIRNEPVLPSESLVIEYDLYYIKQGSPLLDIEIFLRTLFGGGKRDVRGNSGPLRAAPRETL